ncbi:MAG TPA: hypothetical protein VIH99_04545 [Bdellovibrionota bacterium]|jgi:hypothetical protein
MQSFRLLWLLVGMALLPFTVLADEGDDPLPMSKDPTLSPPFAQPRLESDPWFRNPGEFLSSRSIRMSVPNEVNTKIITDAKRFDVSLGKRVPLLAWGEEGLYEGWAIGVDGGMLASLVRYSNNGRLTFATNTFDGTFGAFVGFTNGDGWLGMFRTAHLSAHLVDNSPRFLTPIGYSQFWNEVTIGKSFPEWRNPSSWDLHFQGTVGFNNTSAPAAQQPRGSFGMDFGHTLSGPDTLAILASGDVLRAGVVNQPVSYTFFLGLGYLNRPETSHRPFRMGVVWFRGSDYRNQLYFNRQNWVTFQLATEF